MAKTELLAPAGSFEVGLCALYGKCDAIYLALDSFGARAYAKNFTMEELKEIIKIAHALDKKVYVTVNTIIKNSELDSVYNFLDEIYLVGVDAVICADIAVFMYVINNLKDMECHISTQVGVKDLNDTLFFEDLGAKRVVIARENTIEQIKYIRENTKIELEIFIHGALCVSYSGGCLFSSLLSLRSGNRGRCSQNCRREYSIYENGKPITKPGFYLSMKDLCVDENVNELVRLNIDSLKIEGRMKNAGYVDTVLNHYDSIINNNPVDKNKINQIFHRQFTKGFIFNEDRKNIATITDASSQGNKIGYLINRKGNLLLIRTSDVLRKGERIRFSFDNKSEYFTVEKIFDKKQTKIEEGINEFYIECGLNIPSNSTIYKMQDNELSSFKPNSDIIPLNIYVTGKVDEPLNLVVNVREHYINIISNVVLSKAKNNPLTEEVIYRQLNKLNDTPFYIESISCDIDDDLFMSLSSINELRRQLVDTIYGLTEIKRTLHNKVDLSLKHKDKLANELIVSVKNYQQYKAAIDMGIKTIFFENFVPYVGASYNEITEDEVLVANYGGIKHYNKTITSDYSFNVMNKDAVLHLLNFGVSNVTLSHENSFTDIKDIATSFEKQHTQKAPLDFIVYGRYKLMTMKYCPLKKQGMCGKCQNNTYHLVDKFAKFLLVPLKGCYVEIYNDKVLNLIDEIPLISNYVNRIRLDFVDESYEEVVEVINSVKNKTNVFDGNKHTRGYFKRNIF